MSISLYLRARLCELRPAAKALLKEMAFIANDAGGDIRASVATLVQWTGLSRRSVQQLLRELEDDNYITTPSEKRGGLSGPTRYRINLKALPKLAGEKGAHLSVPELSPGAGDAREGRRACAGEAQEMPSGVQQVRGGAHENAQRGATGAPYRPERPTTPEQKPNERAVIDQDLASRPLNSALAMPHILSGPLTDEEFQKRLRTLESQRQQLTSGAAGD